MRKLVLSRNANLTDAGLSHLAPIQTLEYLDLYQTNIGDEGLVHVSQLRRLKSLELDGTHVTDAGMPFLGRIETLETLILRNTAVSDEGLVHLRKLQQLRHLDYLGSGISDEGVYELALHLPNLLARAPDAPRVGVILSRANAQTRHHYSHSWGLAERVHRCGFETLAIIDPGSEN